MKSIEVLIPTYNEEQSIPLLYEALSHTAQQISRYDWRFIFINDGSKDHSQDILEALSEQDERIAVINLSRNFGKENAMLAGIDYAQGDAVIIMDCDLQHPVSIIPEMLKAYEEGYQDVYARRAHRNAEPRLKQWCTKRYYRLLQKSTRFDVLPDVGDFRLLDHRCIAALKQLRETDRYTKGLFCWIGFKKKEITYTTEERRFGKSTFTYFGLLKLALNGLTSFTTAPLRFSTITGCIVSFFAFVYLIYVVIKTLIIGEPVQGFPTLVVLILLLGGLQLLSIGIIGEYIARIFNESKRRPNYIVASIKAKQP
ncbi:glycosyltransferase family 2 protein [Alloprevotella tannerae]|uniref:Glycosyltransferase family 2 protein n=1 Tax=Alloprevotella tannerae TaxID=76122 RepID=A0A929RVW1_9BACT|nr:glycosyltransferase family 2 protein [Alloprevotella tannerae]MBF0970232.1 glycosyltransferase family 2 protein [Alloprevotella tannerae]